MLEEIVELDNTTIDNKTIKVIPRTKPSQDNNIIKSLKEFKHILEK